MSNLFLPFSAYSILMATKLWLGLGKYNTCMVRDVVILKLKYVKLHCRFIQCKSDRFKHNGALNKSRKRNEEMHQNNIKKHKESSQVFTLHWRQVIINTQWYHGNRHELTTICYIYRNWQPCWKVERRYEVCEGLKHSPVLLFPLGSWCSTSSIH